MADEITFTGSGAVRASEILNGLLFETLVDRTDLRTTLIRLGDVGGSGSDTLKTPTVSFDDPFAAANTNETAAAANTALGIGSVSLSVAQQILVYQLSDKFMITGGPGNLNMAQIAANMADAYVLRVTDLVCSTAEGFSTDVTAIGAMDVDNFVAAMAQLEQSSVPGPYSAVLHHKQWTGLQSSLRSETGAVAYAPATYEQIAIKGPGFVGTVMGVDVYSSSSVTDDGTHFNGSMYGLGAMAYVEASPRQAMPGSMAALVTPAGSPVYVEFDRQGDPGLTQVIGHAFCQVGILEDARGVGVLSDI